MGATKQITRDVIMAEAFAGYEEITSEAAPSKKEILESVRINPNEPLSPPKNAIVCISPEGKELPICTRGNFSLQIGKAKSKKTFNIGLLAAAYLSGDPTGMIQGRPEDGKEGVIIFDTEQGKYRVQRAVKRILQMVGRPFPENFNTYNLRKFTPKQRYELIEDELYRASNIGLVIIDGVRDLVTSINDEDQATMMSSALLKWTEELDIHVIVVLHENKNDGNARGHLGAELVNKAEITLKVTKDAKDKNISTVEAEYCRDIDPEPYAFEITPDALPVIIEARIEAKKGTGPEDIDGHKIFMVLTALFSKREKIGYKDLWQGIKYEFKEQKIGGINDNKAKEIVTYSRHKGWVIQDEEKKPYRLGQYEN